MLLAKSKHNGVRFIWAVAIDKSPVIVEARLSVRFQSKFISFQNNVPDVKYGGLPSMYFKLSVRIRDCLPVRLGRHGETVCADSIGYCRIRHRLPPLVQNRPVEFNLLLPEPGFPQNVAPFAGIKGWQVEDKCQKREEK